MLTVIELVDWIFNPTERELNYYYYYNLLFFCNIERQDFGEFLNVHLFSFGMIIESVRIVIGSIIEGF